MNNLIELDLGQSLIAYYDKNKSRGTVIRDKRYNRTTLNLYIFVYEGAVIDFKEIQTTAIFETKKGQSKEEKVLRKYFQEELNGNEHDVNSFKKEVHDNYKDWRKLNYRSNFEFTATKSANSPAQTIYFKFQLPNEAHELPQFEEEETGEGDPNILR